MNFHNVSKPSLVCSNLILFIPQTRTQSDYFISKSSSEKIIINDANIVDNKIQEKKTDY